MPSKYLYVDARAGRSLRNIDITTAVFEVDGEGSVSYEHESTVTLEKNRCKQPNEWAGSIAIMESLTWAHKAPLDAVIGWHPVATLQVMCPGKSNYFSIPEMLKTKPKCGFKDYLRSRSYAKDAARTAALILERILP